MWTTNRIKDARAWLLFLTFLIIVFVFLTAVTLVTGTPTSQLSTLAKELTTLEAKSADITDEEALALREDHLTHVASLNSELEASLTTLLADGDYEAFGEQYGQEMKVVLETELSESEKKTVTVQNQPMLYTDDSYPVSFVFDDSIHVFAYYAMESGQLTPQYVSRESEGE